MGSICQKNKLKIKCPTCGQPLYSISIFDDYFQEEHTTYCRLCGFNETYEETYERVYRQFPDDKYEEVI